MSWLRLDDDMLDHPKWIRALRDGGAEALLVWTRLSLWCSKHLTDGRIPGDTVTEVARLERSKSRARALQALIEHGLCTRHVDGAIVIHGYLERNPSKADTLTERDRRAQAQRDYAHRRKLTGQQPIALPGPDPVALRPPDDVPSPPVPSRPLSLSNESEGERAPALESPPVPGLAVVHPGPLPLSARERDETRLAGARGALRYEYTPGWAPTRAENLARAIELGLTEEELWQRWAECREKPYPTPFRSDVNQFNRELAWCKRDKETIRFQRMAKADREAFELPGKERRA